MLLYVPTYHHVLQHTITLLYLKFSLSHKPLAGYLALEEFGRVGPAVDAKMSATWLVYNFYSYTIWAVCVEETLCRDCAGASHKQTQGEKDHHLYGIKVYLR